jgi:5'-methylthioadenosine phosphorylase/5'-methylthioinosine phosphorylase
MSLLAIIGGSGFDALPGLEVEEQQSVETRYGRTSAPLIRGRINGQPITFLARHGAQHQLAPHRINYRANIQALADAGCSAVVALGAVGGLHESCPPGTLCLPDQLIDYTHGRAQTFYDDQADGVEHVDFTEPYSQPLRRKLLDAAAATGIALRDGGTYGVTQGPRLETAAEVRRLMRDGCDLVGMTAMPEAALAHERELHYATLAFVVNWGAGLSQDPITMDAIEQQIQRCADTIRRLLLRFVDQGAAAGPA